MPRMSSLRSSESRFQEKADREDGRRLREDRGEDVRRGGAEDFLVDVVVDFERLPDDRLPLDFELVEGDFATDLLR
jgi:hypothetical protein